MAIKKQTRVTKTTPTMPATGNNITSEWGVWVHNFIKDKIDNGWGVAFIDDENDITRANTIYAVIVKDGITVTTPDGNKDNVLIAITGTDPISDRFTISDTQQIVVNDASYEELDDSDFVTKKHIDEKDNQETFDFKKITIESGVVPTIEGNELVQTFEDGLTDDHGIIHPITEGMRIEFEDGYGATTQIVFKEVANGINPNTRQRIWTYATREVLGTVLPVVTKLANGWKVVMSDPQDVDGNPLPITQTTELLAMSLLGVEQDNNGVVEETRDIYYINDMDVPLNVAGQPSNILLLQYGQARSYFGVTNTFTAWNYGMFQTILLGPRNIYEIIQLLSYGNNDQSPWWETSKNEPIRARIVKLFNQPSVDFWTSVGRKNDMEVVVNNRLPSSIQGSAELTQTQTHPTQCVGCVWVGGWKLTFMLHYGIFW